MYAAPAFTVDDPDIIEGLIDGARLGVLVTHGPGGLNASHLPFLYDAETRTLRGHLARANPHRSLAGAGPALAILTGAEGYVSPNWYPSKAEHGRHVPTWNYEAVHLHGPLTWSDDPDVLLRLVADLSARHEASQARPWRVTDAPAGYIEKPLSGIVGVEMRVERVEAVRKLSQNRDARDHAGVVSGLEGSPDPRDQMLAARMRETQR